MKPFLKNSAECGSTQIYTTTNTGKVISMFCFHWSQVRHDRVALHESTVELQWLEQRWLIYHGYFELILEFITKNPTVAEVIVFGIISGDFLFYIDNGLLCVLIRIASLRRF